MFTCLRNPPKPLLLCAIMKFLCVWEGGIFALGTGLLKAAIVLPTSPSALERCWVMEMKLRAVLTAGLVDGTCGYQAGGLDTPESCSSFPSQEQLFRHQLSKTAPRGCKHPQSHPPWCSFPGCCPLPAPMVRAGGYSLGQGLQVQVFVATICSSGAWLAMGLPAPSLWTRLDPCRHLTEPASQADGFPAPIEERLHDEPCAQQRDEQHRVPDHNCKGWERSQVRVAAAWVGDWSIPLASRGLGPCVPTLQSTR